MLTSTTSPLNQYTSAELRRRRSVKWTEFPPDVLPMRIAEMDTPLAEPIAAALLRAVSDGDTGYASPGRLPDLFTAFAARRYGWHPDPSAMRLVPDVMSGIVEVLRLVTEPGDTVVVNTPGYPPYFSQLARIGLRLTTTALIPGPEGYRLDLNRLERAFAAGAKAFLLCNPHNPTGTVFTQDELSAVADLAERHGVRVVVDEILAPLVHAPRRHIPFLSLDRPAAARSVCLGSASKAWNLAGLKAALAVPGADARATVAELDGELGEGAGLFGVLAAEAAFADGEPWLDDLLRALDGNRLLLADELRRRLPDVGYRPPDAGFTAWLDFRALGLPEDPAERFLRRGRVGVSSGLRFSPQRQPGASGEPGAPGSGAGFVRLNFATRPDLVAEAVRRIAAAVSTPDSTPPATQGLPPRPAGDRVRQQALGGEQDWSSITAEELAAYRDAENRRRASPEMQAITGKPDPGVAIEWQELPLPGRGLAVRTYRPTPGPGSGPVDRALPLVLHVHGGGFVGTAVQSDWVNSRLAAQLPAVVVSVEHRLLAPDTPLSAAADDGWEALRHLLRHAADHGIDPTRTAVFGESCGALIVALAAIRASASGLRLRAQVLVNPAVDVTDAMFDHPSMLRHADSPTLTVPQLRLLQSLAVPSGTDARALSPLHAADLTGLAPALAVVPTHDPLADHGRRYAERLRAAGTPTHLTEYPGVGHAFLSMPGVVPQAESARTEIVDFLRAALS